LWVGGRGRAGVAGERRREPMKAAASDDKQRPPTGHPSKPTDPSNPTSTQTPNPRANSMLESISEVVDLVEPALLGQAQVEAAFDGLRHVLKQAERRREARAKRLQQVRAVGWTGVGWGGGLESGWLGYGAVAVWCG